MTTITEDYVSFETAKLLKEKGFDEFSSIMYKENGEICVNPKSVVYWRLKYWYPCLTLQMAMKWLREKYNIYISIQPDFPSDKDYKMCWCWSASILHENCISTKWNQCYIETYEQACEAAIKYCLENLI